MHHSVHLIAPLFVVRWSNRFNWVVILSDHVQTAATQNLEYEDQECSFQTSIHRSNLTPLPFCLKKRYGAHRPCIVDESKLDSMRITTYSVGRHRRRSAIICCCSRTDICSCWMTDRCNWCGRCCCRWHVINAAVVVVPSNPFGGGTLRTGTYRLVCCFDRQTDRHYRK